MKTKFLLFSVILLAVGGSAFAQTGAVTGVALDNVGNTVAGATITVCPNGSSGIPCSPVTASTTSNGQGAFSVTVPVGTYTVTVFRSGVVATSSTIVVAPSNITVANNVTYAGTVTYSGTVAFPGNTSLTNVTVSGTGTFTGTLNCTIVNLIRCVSDTNPQGWAGTTPDAWITSAMANCPAAGCEIDVALSAPVFASTIAWPAKTIALKFVVPTLVTGPASGPMFLANLSGTNGSAIYGVAGITQNGQAQYGNSTIFRSNASNTSPLIQILSGTTQTIQGWRLENLALDGNNSATDLLQVDGVRNSHFMNISYNNCTGWGIHSIVTQTAGNQGTQGNEWDGIYGGGCNALIMMDGNATATSSTTLNTFKHIFATFSCASCAGIEIKQGDGNTFNNIMQLFPTAVSFTGDCVKVDAPAAGVEGGLHNYFESYHVGCAQGAIGGNSFHAGANTYNNKIIKFNGIENQAAPVVDAGALFEYEIDRANQTNIFQLNANKFFGWAPAGGNVPDVGFLRASVGRIVLSTAYNTAAQGSLGLGIINYVGATSGQVNHTAPGTVTSYTETDPAAAPTVANAVKQYTTGGVASFSASPGTLTIANGTAAMTTALIAAGACGTTVTVAATGAATTDIINVSRNAAVTNANGGILTLNWWPTSGNVNFNYCNPTAAGVTPTAMTLNWSVMR